MSGGEYRGHVSGDLRVLPEHYPEGGWTSH